MYTCEKHKHPGKDNCPHGWPNHAGVVAFGKPLLPFNIPAIACSDWKLAGLKPKQAVGLLVGEAGNENWNDPKQDNPQFGFL